MATFPYPNIDKHDPVRRLARRVQDLPTFFSVPPRVYLVGGAVRDIIARRPLTDIDVEVYGVGAEALKDLLYELFPIVNEMGASFAICKIRDDQGREVDVALPRREVKAGEGHKDFSVGVVPDLSFAEATARRDFTMNAMLLDPLTGELIDPWTGQKDTRKHVLRSVDPVHFGEDPLRVWRAVQFVARFGLTVDPATMELMRQMVASGELATLSKERVTVEWRKLLLASHPSLGIALANELGIMPGGACDDASLLDTAAAFFTTHNVDEETALVVMLACLMRSYGFAEDGTKAWFDTFTWGSDVEHAVLRVPSVAAAIDAWDKERRTGALMDAKLVNAARVIVKDLPKEVPDAPVLFAHAMSLQTSGKESVAAGAFVDIVMRENLFATADKPLLSAKEVMRLAGLEPGPDLGRVLEELEVARDAGDVLTIDDAKIWVEKRIKRSA